MPKRCIQCKTGVVKYSSQRKCAACKHANELAYRERRKAAAISPLVRKAVWDEARGRCEVCGVAVHRRSDRNDHRQTVGEVDHIVPVILGGTNDRSNLQLCCKACNRKRDAQMRSTYLSRGGA